MTLAQAHKVLYEAGYTVRCEVAGKDHVDRSLAAHSSDFSRPMQELATEAGWGWIWTRPGLEKKMRSLLNLAMLCAMSKSNELGVHVRGAFNNGASEVEVRETLLQAAIYAGLPAGLEAFRVAERVLEELRNEESKTS
ncbi:MAG: hypothetical protein Q9227_000034 [Pyrenula ochraceoflavens]